MKHNKIIVLTIIMFIFLLTGCGSIPQTDDVTASLKGEEFILSLVNYDDAVITRGFMGYEGHKGVDIAAPEGTHIYAADDGTVEKLVVMNMGYGNHIVIDHGEYKTLYAHCQAFAGVKVGDIINKGTHIAYVGNTGNSTGAHLHLEVISDDVNYNPTEWYK